MEDSTIGTSLSLWQSSQLLSPRPASAIVIDSNRVPRIVGVGRRVVHSEPVVRSGLAGAGLVVVMVGHRQKGGGGNSRTMGGAEAPRTLCP